MKQSVKKRLVVSTAGTSLLTRQAEKYERQILTCHANDRHDECPENVVTLVKGLRERALVQLKSSDVGEIRKASAELNGLIGINGGQLPSGNEDMHFLIATDTLQGKATAGSVASFLRENCGCSVEVFSPPGLSTRDGSHFSEGIKNLLKWCEETIDGYRSAGYEIVFNLTGGFKSLQGYLNTIGMFYADRMVYIFESPASELIEIPRLPVTIDLACFKAYSSDLALLAAGRLYRTEDFPRLPEALLDSIDGNVILSLWGELMWNRAKASILSDELLEFPCLSYSDSFVRDFRIIRNEAEKVKLHETLAKASFLLEQDRGGTGLLKRDGGIQYEDFNNRNFQGKPIGHFRVTQSLRVSCVSENGRLILRHYGAHDYVNDNP